VDTNSEKFIAFLKTIPDDQKLPYVVARALKRMLQTVTLGQEFDLSKKLSPDDHEALLDAAELIGVIFNIQPIHCQAIDNLDRD
jgi:hypothetical protein